MLKPIIAATALFALAGTSYVYAQQGFGGHGGYGDGAGLFSGLNMIALKSLTRGNSPCLLYTSDGHDQRTDDRIHSRAMRDCHRNRNKQSDTGGKVRNGEVHHSRRNDEAYEKHRGWRCRPRE